MASESHIVMVRAAFLPPASGIYLLWIQCGSECEEGGPYHLSG